MSDLDIIPGEGEDLPNPQFSAQPDQPAEPTFDDAFSAMESEISADMPEGSFVTLRSGSNAPLFAPLFEGETAVPIRLLADRCHLMFGGAVNVYLDSAQASMDTPAAAGSVVTFVGNVKGG